MIAALNPCASGHRWRHIGGRNCGCHPDALCSVPVHRCDVCGDFDYGDNSEAARTKEACSDVEECKAKGPAIKALHLTRAEFDALPEYSATLPTGTTPGKRWRRHDGAYDPSCKKPQWLIGEYGEINADGKTIALNWYWPVIVVPGSGMVSGEVYG
jgi:hypothetical protein